MRIFKKFGRLQKVENKDRKFGAGTKYIAVWVDQEKGKHARCLMFTELEINDALARAQKNIEDVPKNNWL